MTQTLCLPPMALYSFGGFSPTISSPSLCPLPASLPPPLWQARHRDAGFSPSAGAWAFGSDFQSASESDTERKRDAPLRPPRVHVLLPRAGGELACVAHTWGSRLAGSVLPDRPATGKARLMGSQHLHLPGEGWGLGTLLSALGFGS